MNIKRTSILLLLLLYWIFPLSVYSQYKPLKENPKDDSLWIKQLFELKQEEYKAMDTVINYQSGKVYYTPDRLCRFATLSAQCTPKDEFPVYYNFNYVQFSYNNKLITKQIPDSFGFEIHPENKIYILPHKTPAYLIINSYKHNINENNQESKELPIPGSLPLVTDTVPSDTNPQQLVIRKYCVDKENNIKWGISEENYIPTPVDTSKTTITDEILNFSACSLILDGAELDQLSFDDVPDYSTDDYQYVEPEKYSNMSFSSNEILHEDSLKPYLNYDPKTKHLQYLYIDSDEELLKVHRGTYLFQDSIFAIDSSKVYYNNMKEDTIATQTFIINNIPITVLETKKAEEIGEGVLNVTHIKYNVRDTIIDTYQMIEPEDEDSKAEREDSTLSLKPEVHKLDKNTSVLLGYSTSTPNTGGACGGCEYDDTDFWVIDKDSIYSPFYISNNVGAGYIDGPDERFYVESDSTYIFVTIDSTYWKNSNTYVYVISSETKQRTIYIHFQRNPKTQLIDANIEYGKLVVKPEEKEKDSFNAKPKPAKFVLTNKMKVILSFTIAKNGKKVIVYQQTDEPTILYLLTEEYKLENYSLHYVFLDKKGMVEFSYPLNVDPEYPTVNFKYATESLSFDNNDASYKIWAKADKLGVEILVNGKSYFMKGDAKTKQGGLSDISKLKLYNVK